MCGPLAAAGVGLVGSVIQGIGASKQASNAASQEARASENQARGYERNAKFQAKDYRRQATVQATNLITQAAVHARQADLERIKGSWDAARMTEKGRGIIGDQIAAFASSGIAVSGSIADVVQQTGESLALDLMAQRYGTRIAIENENILENINRKQAKDALKYGEQAATDALKYGKAAAKDVRRMGVAAAADYRSASALSFISPVIAGVGTFLGSGAFNGGYNTPTSGAAG